MEFLSNVPFWLMAVAIFCLRIVDVSLGTIRTILVVQGRQSVAVLIGFIEVLVWVTAVSQVIWRIHDSPLLAVAFAAGFATGNAVGIQLERRLAIGTCVLRIIARESGDAVATTLRDAGLVVTTFDGQGRDGVRKMIHTTCPRRDVTRMIKLAKGIDPDLFYIVDRFSQAAHLGPLPHPTGWRAVFKKK
ncbi:MAG: DUF2179 domain-containing protein [Gemmatimonadota bacterium]|nr:MAG: DUF2179 domain-containing protein [Gemmatimonadota bacterium]